MANKITVKKLRSFFDKEGELFEVLRSDDSLYDGTFGQNLVSIVSPGITKGFHKHRRQTEYTTCIKGNILYIAVTEIPEQQPRIQKFIIGEKNRILIKTPPGIWHGYKSLNDEEAIVLYTMDKPYNPNDTDTLDKNPLAFGDIWYQD